MSHSSRPDGRAPRGDESFLTGRPAPHLVVVSRFRGAADLAPALEILAGCAGCRSAELGQSTDDAQLQLLITTWDSVGAYRKALSSYEVKAHAVPLLSHAIDEPSAFEIVLSSSQGAVLQSESGLSRAQPRERI